MSWSLTKSVELFDSSFGILDKKDRLILGLVAQRSLHGRSDFDGELDFIVLQESREGD